MLTPTSSDSRARRDYEGEAVRLVRGGDRKQLPVVVDNGDSGHIFSPQTNSSNPAWSQAATLFNDQWDEVHVGGVWGAWRSKFWCQSNRSLEDRNLGFRAWLWEPVVDSPGPTKDNLSQGVRYSKRRVRMTVSLTSPLCLGMI